MKKAVYILASLSLIFNACSKNQKVVKDLEGEWKLSAETVNGVATPAAELVGTKYTFTKCKVRKEDCDGTLSVPDSTKGNLATPFTYNIQEKGEKINIKFSLLGLITEINGTIEEHSDTKFVYSFTSPTGNEKVTETLTK